jgi:hypothetical protein
MALHRDIFWIGRQWAVTGFGIQAINQKHDGQFDIPIERLWDDDLLDGAREQKWFNPDDFAKGLAIAQARHPRPPPKPKPAAPPAAETPRRAAAPTVAPEQAPLPAIPAVESFATIAPESVKPVEPPPSFTPMRLLGHPAKLVRVWQARRRR